MVVNYADLVSQLRATLGRMEVALGAIADAIVWTGTDGKVQWCNAAFDKLVNQPHILVLGLKLIDLLPLTQMGQPISPESYPDVLVLKGEYEAAEYEFQQSSCSLILEISGNSVELADGDKSAVLVIRDITQDKRLAAERSSAEQKREESLSLLRSTLEATADGILVVDRNLNVPVFNQKFLQIWSMPESLVLPSMGDERLKFMAEQTRDPEAFIAKAMYLFFECPEQESFDSLEFKDGRIFERYSQPQWNGNEINGRVWSYREITERKRSEVALSESEAKFRRIVENANDIISLIALDGRISYISPNLTNLTGYDPSELEGGNFITFLHPDDQPRCLEAVHQVVTTGDKQSGIEYRARLKDGSWQWQSTNLAMSQDAKGNLVIISVARVITERKQAEEALRLSELKYRNIVEKSQVGIWRCQMKDGLVLDANQRFVELLGYQSTEEVIGKKFTADFYANREQRQWVVNELRKHGKFKDLELQFRRQDGSLHWGLFSLHLNAEDDCSEGVLTDISDRKQVEEALRQSESRYRALVTASAQSVFTTNAAGEVVDSIPLWEALTGQSESQTKGMGWLDCIHPDDRESTMQAWLEAVYTGSLYEVEQRIRIATGEYRLFLVRGVPVLDDQGNIREWVGTQTDITNRKRSEEALRLSELKYRNIFENSQVGIGRTRLEDGLFLDVNQRYAEIMGFSCATDLIGKRFTSEFYASPGDRERILAELKQYGEVRNFEEQLLRPDGSTAWGLLSLRLNTEENCLDFVIADITDRKLAEAALHRSNAILKAQQEASIDGILVVDENNLIVSYNKRFCQLWQIPEPLIHNSNSPKLLQWVLNQLEQPEEFLAKVEYLYAHPEVVSRDEIFMKDGRTLDRYSASVRSPTGDYYGRIWYFRDITERKQAEAELQHRAQVDSLLNRISRQLIDQDVDTAINYTLRAIAEFMQAQRSCIFDYFESQRQFQLVHEWRTADIEPLPSTAGDSAIEPFPWFYSQILSGNPVQGLQVSRIADTPTEAAQEKESELLHKEFIQSVVVVPMIHSAKVVGLLELDVVNCSKTWSQEEINLLQRVSELIAIGRSRYQAEEALRVAKEAAEAANRAKSAFLANMSHELRTPLNAILGFAQLMERDPTLTNRQRDSLATINRSGEHLLKLINDVLEMSKIEAGRIVLNQTPFDLHRLLQTIQEMFQVRAQAKQLSLQVELTPNLPQYILTDEGKLQQVLINLLGNAIKFTDTGRVTLRVSSVDNHVSVVNAQTNHSRPITIDPEQITIHFEVEDTGKGIVAEELDNLFQPFVQTESGVQVREGTGLGLTISRQFVQLMGGDIRLTSVVDRGSTFYFDIKVELAKATEVALPTPKERVIRLAPGQPTYRILVVDDRQENCDLLTQLLNSVGFETRAAANGQEAIAYWQTWHPHLIWMDMRMPVMDGYEATRKIRAAEKLHATSLQHQPTVIIALTASAFEEQRSKIFSVGCDEFIRKPFREEVIFSKMAEHLGVQYVYAEEQESIVKTEFAASGLEDLKPTDLMAMPEEWVTSLHQAAVQVDAELIFQLIEQIPETHLTLAQGLADLVNHFCFDEIIELTQGDNNA